MFSFFEEKKLSDLIEKLEQVTNEPIIVRIGEMGEYYHIGNGEFKKIYGELYLCLNCSNKYRLIHNNGDNTLVDDFDVFDSRAEVRFSNILEKKLYELIEDVFKNSKEECINELEIGLKRFNKHIIGEEYV